MKHWGLGRKITFMLLIVLLAGFAWRCVRPFLHSELGQDACEFSPVSNARYRELLAEAKRRDATVWPRLRAYGWQLSLGKVQSLQAGITDRVKDLTTGMTSIYEKLAAIMPSQGPWALITGGYPAKMAEPFWLLDLPYSSIGFRYEIDVMMFGSSEPFIRTAALSFNINTSTRPVYGETPGKFRAALLWPKWLQNNARVGAGLFPPCPRMPPAEFAERFDAWAAKLP